MKPGPKPKHGHRPWGKKPSRLYMLWGNMKRRCYYPRDASYQYYGGRGINVCDRWRYDFTAFMADVGPHPGKGWTLDRVDPFGDYELGNVRWASPKTQARNRTTTILTQAQVDEIRRDYVPYKVIARSFAERFGVSTRIVLSVIQGKKWQ